MSSPFTLSGASSQLDNTPGHRAPHEESLSNPPRDAPSNPTSLTSAAERSFQNMHHGQQQGAHERVTRRSTRAKGHALSETTPLPARRQVPRKQHFEFLRAPSELVAAFRAARTEYHDAVYAWWYSQPREREEKPSAEDYARVKLDPRVQRTGRKLDEIDAELTRRGIVVKSSTLTNGWAMHKKIRDEEFKLDREHYTALHAREELAPHHEESLPAPARNRPPLKRKCTGPPPSSASTSTSRGSTHDTAITTPEPDPVAETKKECRVEHHRFARKRARVQ